MVAQRSLTPLV